MGKRSIVRWFVNCTSGWNKEFHDAVEQRVKDDYRQQFTQAAFLDIAVIRQMQESYYQRMMTTANLLIGISAVIVSFVALLVSAVALFK